MNDNIYNNKKLTSPAKAQKIIQYCRQKYINILPNNTVRPANTKRPILATNEPHQISSINPSIIIYKKQQVKQVMRQLSIFLQLVIQNCLLSSDSKIKAQSYRILGTFRNLLSRDLDQFQTMIYNRNKSKLPFYQIQCKDFINRSLDLKLPPQVSLYQDPLLFYIYTRYAQDQLFINHSVHVSRQLRIEILKRHAPFLDPLLIPIVSQRLQTKAKFSQLQDRLLLILVKSKLDLNQYRSIYFPSRAYSQIKNRIKNLCGNGKQQGNCIKQIKSNQYLSLTQKQIQKIIKGFSKYGPRWPVISKYYDVRSAQFLDSQYNSEEKLIKKRQKQKIKPDYDSLKKIIDVKIQQISKKQTNQIMQIQVCEHIEIINQQKRSQHHTAQRGQQIQQQVQQQVTYKIINHLTFEYHEI